MCLFGSRALIPLLQRRLFHHARSSCRMTFTGNLSYNAVICRFYSQNTILLQRARCDGGPDVLEVTNDGARHRRWLPCPRYFHDIVTGAQEDVFLTYASFSGVSLLAVVMVGTRTGLIHASAVALCASDPTTPTIAPNSCDGVALREHSESHLSLLHTLPRLRQRLFRHAFAFPRRPPPLLRHLRLQYALFQRHSLLPSTLTLQFREPLLEVFQCLCNYQVILIPSLP
jgi:hypothetical protein